MTNNLRSAVRLGRLALFVSLIVAMASAGALPAYAAGLTVTSLSDGAPANDGQCTLREAIINANANNQSGSVDCAAGSGVDTIGFNIPGTGVQTIALTAALPNITDPVIIDGTTQPGASCAAWPPTLQIELDGSGTTNATALNFLGIGSSTVRGLVVHSFFNGIELANSSNNVIECNFLGTDASGTQARPNSLYGIQIQQAASGNTIGGPLVSQRNLISSNSTQIGIDNFGSKPSGNTIQNNYIGTDVTGSFGLGAYPSEAISMYGSDANNILGNRIYSTGNFAINGRGGVNISGDITRTSVGNIIQGNVIGVAANGTTATGSVAPAINLYPSDNNSAAISGTIIGGSGPGQGNLLSGNNGEGIYAFANATTIEGNLIGTQADGALALGNQASGITIQGSGNVIGGIGAGQRNVIANNTGGVRILAGSGNRIRGNSISNNGGLGIDLGADGVTFNHQDVITGPNNYQNYPVLTIATSYSNSTRVAGTLNGAPGTLFDIDVYASPVCDQTSFGEGRTYLGSFTAGTSDAGEGSFDQTLPVGVAEPQGVTATATNTINGDTSEFSYCRPVATPNLNWVQAQDVVDGTAQQYITDRFQEKWFKFPVQPGDKVHIKLTSLPGSAVSLHRDPNPIYNGLTNPQNAAVLSAEAADIAFLPSGSLPSGSLPSGSLPSGSLPSGSLPSGSLPTGYLPSGSLPSGSLPSGSLPSGSLPSGSLPSGSLPSGSLPSGSLPSGSLPSGSLPSGSLPSGSLPSGSLPSGSLPSGSLPSGSLDAYASAARRSLLGIAMDPYATIQTIDRNTYDLQENLYVRVVGPYSLATPFTLQVTIDEGVCGGVAPIPSNLLAISGGATGGTHKSLILTHSGRLPGTANEVGTALDDLQRLAGRDDVDGVVIDLADPKYERVAWAYSQADRYLACPSARNMVATEIKRVIDAYRAANTSGGTTTLQYIVLAGGADVIPFFQVQDVAGLANEREYVVPVAPSTASEAGLKSGLVQGQDGYGSQVDMAQAGHTIAIPDLAVGRLVDTASDISAAVDAYITTNGVVAPHSSLVTGYDFVGDAAQAIKAEIEAGTASTADALIQAPGLPPSDSSAWTADQLRTKLLAGGHDIAVLSGHFSAGNLLAADYRTNLAASEIAQSTTDLTNVIVLALGCHGGYTIPGVDVLDGASPAPDWAKAFLRKHAAGFVAATGYAYGDTELTEYGERLFVALARQIRTGSGPIALGKALVAAKRQYLAETAQLTGIDEKTVVEMALYGLPMMKINLPGQRLAPPAEDSIIGSTTPAADGPGAALGLSSANANLSPSVTNHTVPLENLESGSTITTSYLSGADGVIANPFEPIYPKEIHDVSVSDRVLRGVAFRGGTYTDQSGVTPLTTAPAIDTSVAHRSFYTDVFYPNQTWLPNYYDAFDGGPARLMAFPAQFKSSAPDATDGILRTFSALNLRLYYLPSNWTAPGSSATVKAAAVGAAPSILGASAAENNGSVVFSVNAQSDGSADVQAVWVVYTGKAGTPYYGRWQPLDLALSTSDPTLWEGTLALEPGAQAQDIEFMVQAVGGAGLTTLATNLGAYYAAAPSAPTTPPPPPVQTALTLQSPPASGVYLKERSFSILLTAAGSPLGGKRVTLDIGGQQAQATTDSSGRATLTIKPVVTPGSYTVQASFRGDADYLGSTDARAFTVVKDTTSVSVTPASATVQPNQPTPIVAVVRDSAGQALGGKSIIFVVHNSAQRFARSVIADYMGNAPLGAVPLPAGTYIVDAYFNGTIPLDADHTLTLDDDYYTSSNHLGASLTIAGQSDTTPPTVTISGVSSGAVYTLGAVPAASCTATDAPANLAIACSGTLTGGLPNGVGTFTYTATATDQAGNSTTISVIYRVIYRFDGFLQPINDTVRPEICGSPCPISIFKGGSTVPTKFQLKDAHGNVVQAASLPQWVTPQKGGSMSAPIDESVYTGAATSGTSYRWDSTTQQYIYNWGTKSSASGFYWRIGVTLDDGQTYYVNVGLR